MATGRLNPGCIFCKIIRGDVPCQRVLDSERVLAFLDINPLAAGHTIVLPKHHVSDLIELPDEWAAELGRSFGRIAKVVVETVGAEGFNVLQNNGTVAGQVVPHVHFHVVPRRAGDGLGFRWKARAAVPAELNDLAQRIRAALDVSKPLPDGRAAL